MIKNKNPTFQKNIVQKLLARKVISENYYKQLLVRFPKASKGFFSKSEILAEYEKLLEAGKTTKREAVEEFLKTKPTRTLSGVAPVTVLTKPFPCPGKCIFCPTASDQPKSYLSSEPGAARAKMLHFDPYLQTKLRIQALANNGHNTDKIELIILGGTWSFYPRKYQLWFIVRCFQAMNDSVNLTGFDTQDRELNRKRGKDYIEKSVGIASENITSLKKLLLRAQVENETARHKSVGISIETRPDFVTLEELLWLRFLGVTKIQIGIQTLDDKLLKLNGRSHSLKDTEMAVSLIRLAGYKIHAHWMVNLYGASPESDYKDFRKLFSNIAIRPDELKIYPCLLLKGTELFSLYKLGKYKPYSRNQLLELLIKCKSIIPPYCRISRLFRDIPSFEIYKGVKQTNFRQIVLEEMRRRGQRCNCIRCNEVRGAKVNVFEAKLNKFEYETNVTKEVFLSFRSFESKIIGFLRLSLPHIEYSKKHFIPELRGCAVIREVHVYGHSLRIEDGQNTRESQHRGIGKRLIKEAEGIARKNNFRKLAVISAVGTRQYYAKFGFKVGKLYMSKTIYD